MSDTNDQEIEKINQRKLDEILSRKKSQSQSASKPILLTDANFTSEVSKRALVVVDFWAAWCGPCRMVSPVIEQLAQEYAGKVVFGKLNVDENPRTSSMFDVQSIPTILVFKNGKRVDGLVGAMPKSFIESKFKPYIEGNPGSLYR